ncbi:MAG: PIN domain-containing protein, partial [Sphingomonas sp.]
LHGKHPRPLPKEATLPTAGFYSATLSTTPAFRWPALSPPHPSLLWLAKEQLFRPLWSDQILDEWARSVARKRTDITAEKLAGHRKEMLDAFEDSMVAGAGISLDGLNLPDPKDAHVIETAVIGKADAIVTTNLKHFPPAELAKVGLEAIHPDRFLVNLIDLDPVRAIGALKRQRESMTQSNPTIEDYLARFENCRLIQSRLKLSEYEELL